MAMKLIIVSVFLISLAAAQYDFDEDEFHNHKLAAVYRMKKQVEQKEGDGNAGIREIRSIEYEYNNEDDKNPALKRSLRNTPELANSHNVPEGDDEFADIAGNKGNVHVKIRVAKDTMETLQGRTGDSSRNDDFRAYVVDVLEVANANQRPARDFVESDNVADAKIEQEEVTEVLSMEKRFNQRQTIIVIQPLDSGPNEGINTAVTEEQQKEVKPAEVSTNESNDVLETENKDVSLNKRQVNGEDEVAHQELPRQQIEVNKFSRIRRDDVNKETKNKRITRQVVDEDEFDDDHSEGHGTFERH